MGGEQTKTGLRGKWVQKDGTLYPGPFLVLRIATAALLLWGGFHLARNGRLSFSGARATGHVVELVSHKPVVEFQTPAARAVRFQSAASIRRPTPYHPGDAVKVLYLPDSPETAEIDDPRFLWAPGAFLVFLGGMFLAVCVAGRPRR